MSDRPTWTADAHPLHDGVARGVALVLDEPLSFWGGVDQHSGLIIDRRHPQNGRDVTGRVLIMPAGRGSSSSSSVLAEALRNGHGPAAVVLAEPDPILALGALVAGMLDGVRVPVVVAEASVYARLRTGDRVAIEAGGRLSVEPG